jgi:micrococcal nuclease
MRCAPSLVLIGFSAMFGLIAEGRASDGCQLSASERATVATAEDGDTLLLTDGRTVRLMGALAPAPPLGWRDDKPWPKVSEAKAALAGLAEGKDVELKFDRRHEDRHGHLLAHAFVLDGGQRIWLQDALIGQGLARAYSFPDNRLCFGELSLREAAARKAIRGLWAVSAYRVRDAVDAEDLGRLVHSYQLVEGRVAAVGEGAGRVYLNFGADWRKDFTISIERKDVAAFAAAGIDLKALAGKRVRARGWLQWRGGPEIRATHAEQIEVLEDGVTERDQSEQKETPSP